MQIPSASWTRPKVSFRVKNKNKNGGTPRQVIAFSPLSGVWIKSPPPLELDPGPIRLNQGRGKDTGMRATFRGNKRGQRHGGGVESRSLPLVFENASQKKDDQFMPMFLGEEECSCVCLW